MKFLAATRDAILWIGTVLARFMRVRRGTTVLVVAYTFLARICGMLAFILPLKVILLAGANGVPSYFKPFLTASQKQMGIAVLATLAIACYFLMLIFESLAKRHSEKGGDALIAVSTAMSIISNQRGEIQSYYSRFTGLVATAIFILTGLGALLPLDPLLVLHLVLFAAACLLFTGWALRPRADHTRTKMMELILEDSSKYLKILSSLAFLSGFLVILYPLLNHHRANILFAIISVVIFRRLLGAATDAVKEIAGLSRQRHIIDALVFPQARLRRVDDAEHGSLHGLFARGRREERFQAACPELAAAGETVAIRWLDPFTRSAHAFAVSVTEAGGERARHFQQHAYTARQARLLENEELLFSHVERADLFAPPLVARYAYGPFECVVYEAGSGRRPSASSWPRMQRTFLTRLACLRPPKPVLAAFKSSHLLLGERLSDELVDRLEIAAEAAADAERLEAFRAALPGIRAAVDEVPLCIVNPDFRLPGTVMLPDGGFHVMSWGQWHMEPFGAVLEGLGGDAHLNRLLARARAERSDLPPTLGGLQVRLANDCARLEKALRRGDYRAAIVTLKLVLSKWTRLQNGPAPTEAEPEAIELPAEGFTPMALSRDLANTSAMERE